MFKVYFDPKSNGFYQTDIHTKIPSTAVEITEKQRWELLEGASKGKIIVFSRGIVSLVEQEVTTEEVSATERVWRNSEIKRADIELYKVQDSDPKAVGGVSDWRSYRKSLRAWPESPYFPKQEFRPKAPDWNKE